MAWIIAADDALAHWYSNAGKAMCDGRAVPQMDWGRAGGRDVAIEKCHICDRERVMDSIKG